MSLILDALNRSQRDKDNLDAVPGLDTIHPVQTMSSARVAAICGVSLLCCFLVVAAAWLYFKSPAEKAAGSTITAIANPSVKAPLQNQALTPSVAPNEMPAQQTLPARSRPNRAEQLASLGSSVSLEAPANEVTDLYNIPKPNLPNGKPAAAKKARQSLAASTRPPADTLSIEDVLSRAKAELDTKQLPEHSAPFIMALSQQVKDSIPTIYYSVHDYSSDSANSYAVLNGQRVTAGESIAGKLTVKEILPDSIVLTMRGIEFRLKALNSWINL